MAGEILHLRGGRTGVGRDGDRSQLDAGKPGQQRLDAIIQVNEDVVALPDAALDQASGQRPCTLVKFAVGPFACRQIKRRPDQERMVAPDFRAHLEQPGHVQPGKGADHARSGRGVVHLSSRAALPAAFSRLLEPSFATGNRNGQMPEAPLWPFVRFAPRNDECGRLSAL
jgi:hypothetical protein